MLGFFSATGSLATLVEALIAILIIIIFRNEEKSQLDEEIYFD
jgi:hypothetical protein